MRSSSVLVPVPVILVAVAVASACATAGGDVQGGGLTDAGAAATTPPKFDETATRPPAPCNGSGTTWTDLYRDIFGPTGGASCALRSNCHGPNGSGATSNAGIKCFDQKGCRQSLFDKNMVTADDAKAPEKSNLVAGELRQRMPDGTLSGSMPQEPADYIFSDMCLQRIEQWIRDGAPDN